MNTQEIMNIVELLLLQSNEALSITQLQAAFEEWEKPNKQQLSDILQVLDERYQDSGMELVESSGKYRIQSRKEYAPWLSRAQADKPIKYSRATMETLAIIAYKQPVTRADIEGIRGVAVSSNIIKSLLERGWIKISGHRDIPGRPAIFMTTQAFLEHFNLQSLTELPVLQKIQEVTLPV